ncbi:MAG: zinc ribbon domain-containing protein [Pseudomonadota bacterium]
MPIYQYRCQACQHELEAIQKISDPKLIDCPACGAPSLKKQVTAAAFKLKGTGWYETDFKNSGKPPAKSNDTSDKSSTSTAGDSAETSNNSSTNTEGAASGSATAPSQAVAD